MNGAISAAEVLGALGKSPTYAVLDGARDGRVGSLAKGELVRCLYRGTLPREINDAAPQLMRVWPGNEPTERYFKQGWHDAWGVLLSYAGPIKALHRHLRRFLRVRGENGRIFAFRWYDPRVLRVYLPTCTPAEIERFFGPIEAFAAEDESPNAFVVFRRALRGFEQKRITRRGARLVRTWDHAEPADRDGPLVVFRSRQLRAFQERLDEEYVGAAAVFLRRRLRGEIRGLSTSALRDRCRDALRRAAGYGLSGDDVFSFVAMTFTVSPRFDSHPSFGPILRDEGIPPGLKLASLYERLSAGDWIEARGLR